MFRVIINEKEPHFLFFMASKFVIAWFYNKKDIRKHEKPHEDENLWITSNELL